MVDFDLAGTCYTVAVIIIVIFIIDKFDKWFMNGIMKGRGRYAC